MYLTGSKIQAQEAELVERLRQKDRKGFAQLYDNYGSALYGVILKIVKIEEVAQDVLQDSFVKIWKSTDLYSRDKGTLFTWILNIARNTAIDKIRSQDYKQNYQNAPIEAKQVDKQANTQTKTDHIGLKSLIERLLPEHQEVIEYLYFKGFTQSEAAEALAIPLGTVKTRVKIALRELRKLTGVPEG
ncbi:MAG: sigma-70 family RNA polymerase sigma factor [Microscillaceae bacterium]|nr:sigma-70 family RNA polymerase sigma factor [Microscillaceae bacterium]